MGEGHIEVLDAVALSVEGPEERMTASGEVDVCPGRHRIIPDRLPGGNGRAVDVCGKLGDIGGREIPGVDLGGKCLQVSRIGDERLVALRIAVPCFEMDVGDLAFVARGDPADVTHIVILRKHGILIITAIVGAVCTAGDDVVRFAEGVEVGYDGTVIGGDVSQDPAVVAAARYRDIGIVDEAQQTAELRVVLRGDDVSVVGAVLHRSAAAQDDANTRDTAVAEGVENISPVHAALEGRTGVSCGQDAGRAARLGLDVAIVGATGNLVDDIRRTRVAEARNTRYLETGGSVGGIGSLGGLYFPVILQSAQDGFT